MEVLTKLSRESRVALVMRWADEVTRRVPSAQRGRPSVRTLRDLVRHCTEDATRVPDPL